MVPEQNILITNSHIILTLDMYFNFSKMGGAYLSAITVEVILHFEQRYYEKKKKIQRIVLVFLF